MKKILVIESDVKTKNFFQECLEIGGFYSIHAENGLIGIQQAKEELPDLIISEISLTQLDGYKVLTRLRQNSSTAAIPLIFVTTKVARDFIRKGMELGADDYLTKPCTAKELLSAIAACLAKRNLLQQCYSGSWSTLQFQPFRETLLVDTIKQINFQLSFPSNSLLSKVFNFIEVNYHQQITLSDVAMAVGYSSTYLTDLVHRQTGQTVQNWIIEYRMTAARSLLLNTDETMETIAASIGYQNVAHFFRQFRQHHGITPQTWRIENRNQQSKNKNEKIASLIEG